MTNLHKEAIYIIAIPQLTLLLPEYLMEFCKLTLTFESADEYPMM